MCYSSAGNLHLIVVERLVCPYDAPGTVTFGKVVSGETKNGSKDTEKAKEGRSYPARRKPGAPTWSLVAGKRHPRTL